MEKILIDGGEFVPENEIEEGDALRRLVQRGSRLVQHLLDLVLASAAIPFDPATGIDVVRANCAGADRGTDPRFVQPIADADNHPIQAHRATANIWASCE
jgi:hypothetical protein